MPYIPKQHEKYNLLPMCRKHGGEVFEYPSELMGKLSEVGVHELDPYGYESLEDYYTEVDKRALQFTDTSILELLKRYKKRMMELNQKENWSILKYIGEDMDSGFGLTNGRYYYWPCTKENATFRGVIDDEEYTAYLYPTESKLWEIAEDPTGMAYRTIFEGENAMSQKEHENMIH